VRGEEETAEAVLVRHRGHRGPPRCPMSRTAARQRVLSHLPAPIASHRPTLLHGRPHSLPTIAHGVALAFPLAGPMGTRLHAAVTALIKHQQHPCNHLRDVVLKATSQRLAGFHGAQRGFFVAVAKDSPEVTLVIESVLRLLFEFQVMSGARARCAEFSVHILRATSC